MTTIRRDSTLSDKGFSNKHPDILVVLAGSGLLVIIMVSLALIGLMRMSEVNQRIEAIVNERNVKTELVYNMRFAARERSHDIQLMFMLDDWFARDERFLHFNVMGAHFAEARIQLLTMDLNDAEKAILEEQGEVTAKNAPIQTEIVELILQGKREEAADRLTGEALPLQNAVLDKLSKLIETQREDNEKAIRETRDHYEQARNQILVLVGIAGIVGIAIVSIVVTRLIYFRRQRRQAEQELMQHRDHLEKLVEERTHELETSNRELESYSYSIAHDLITPLRAITGFAQVLKEDAGKKLTVEEAGSVDRIIRAGKSMARLIDDILDLSRITRCELRLESVDMTEMGKEIAAQIDELEPDRNVEWKINEGLEILADPMLLQRALQNLLSNAHKYSRDADPAVIELGSQLQGKETTYYVSDNGAGFDMQYAGKLFTPFQRLHGSEFEGNGVGLATVDRIVRRHKGRIWAESASGQGTIVFFNLG